MNRNDLLASAILWASAIVASAILDAPVALTLIVLPCLFVASLIIARRPGRPGRRCAI